MDSDKTQSGKLVGKIAIITGGGGGIGRAICRAFAREGAFLAITGRTMGTVQAIAQEINSQGGRAIALQVDVTDPMSVHSMVKKAVVEYQRIDILVNNAGVHIPSGFMDYTMEEWHETLQTNLTGVFVCSQAALKEMLPHKKGKIIHIASTAGKFGSLYQSAYNASKHGVVGLTKCMGLEFASEGINVNAICPGFVNTGMLATSKMKLAKMLNVSLEDVDKVMVSRIPQGRMLEPEEVAHLAVYLASPESDGMTGQSLTLDGGMIMI